VTDAENAPRQEAPPWYPGRKFGGQGTHPHRVPCLSRLGRSYFVRLVLAPFSAPDGAAQGRTQRSGIKMALARRPHGVVRPAVDRPIGPLGGAFLATQIGVDRRDEGDAPARRGAIAPIGKIKPRVAEAATSLRPTDVRPPSRGCRNHPDAGTGNEAPEGVGSPRIDGRGRIARGATLRVGVE
jgi:hypothetical protein